jgi:hypothetical protein
MRKPLVSNAMISMHFEPWRNRDAVAKVVLAEYDRGNTAGI